MPGDETTPYWATKEFFLKILRASLPDITDVQNHRVWLAIAKGDNYLSELYRAEIEYKAKGKTEKTTIIIKVLPEGNKTEGIITEMGVFPKEASMYTVVLPKLKSLLREAGMSLELSSECLASIRTKPTCIVMTDLALSGYKMAERTAGLDMKHCKVLLDKIAHMHAASMIMEQEEPKSVAEYSVGLMRSADEKTAMNQLLLMAVQALAEATAVWKGFEKYSQKLLLIKNDIIEQGLKVTQMRHNSINVLNHGDLWTNNMLFKYETNGDPIDVVFVDFQMSIWSSLGLDLNYFIYTSPKYEIMDERDTFIEYYHKTLTNVLRKLKYKEIPSLQNIKNEIRERALFGFIAAVLVLPVVIFDRSASGGPMDMERLLDSSQDGKAARKAVYQAKPYERMICRLLPYFDELGIFA